MTTHLATIEKMLVAPQKNTAVLRKLQISHQVEKQLNVALRISGRNKADIPPAVFNRAHDDLVKLVDDAMGRVPIQSFESRVLLQDALMKEIHLATAEAIQATTTVTINRATGATIVRVGESFQIQFNSYALTGALAGSVLCGQVECLDEDKNPIGKILSDRGLRGLSRVQLRELERRRAKPAEGGLTAVLTQLVDQIDGGSGGARQ